VLRLDLLTHRALILATLCLAGVGSVETSIRAITGIIERHQVGGVTIDLGATH